MMIAIFDTASGRRLTDARVTAQVLQPGLAPVRKTLEPMEIAGAMSFGNYFAMSGPGPYTIRLAIELPGALRALETEFRYRGH